MFEDTVEPSVQACAQRAIVGRLRPDARIPAVLAWRNATRHRLRFLMTVAGVAVAVFLMVFQGSLLVGFIHAAGRIVTATGGDAWIVARGVACFDFPGPVPRRALDLAREVEGVRSVAPLVAGLSSFVRADGEHRGVVMVGTDRRLSHAVPRPLRTDTTVLDRDGIVIDQSNQALLGIGAVPVSVEIAGQRAEVVRTVAGFGTFLGSPYVFGDLPHVQDILRIDPEEVTYGIVFVEHPPVSGTQLAALRRRLSNVDVLTTREFAARSAWFWLIQTGAGGAIVVAAILGFVVGFVIVLQTMYASTLESLPEFATLKALGASPAAIRRFIAMQAIFIGGLGAAAGLLALDPLAALARAHLVSWIETPLWLRAAGGVVGMAICAAAALSASRTATAVDPMRVLRG